MADDLATRQDYYMPRPLITLTIGATTTDYSSETFEVSDFLELEAELEAEL